MTKQAFGGPWTEVKLEMVTAYLHAYALVMKKQRHLHLSYIDAFAGTGFRSTGRPGDLFGDDQSIVAGSARLALEVDPPFDRYVFIESDRKRFAELQRLAEHRSDLADRMIFRRGNANRELVELCRSSDWSFGRAVVFLDPFGTQVDWTTLEALAATRAMDVWYLVPTGIAINRMLPRGGRPAHHWQARINRMLGDGFWETFYRIEESTDLFGKTSEEARREADLQHIGAGVIARLSTIFPAVARRGAILRARGSELYLLVFCCANPRRQARDIALRIAEHILGKG